jgi:hypothetical protein
MKFLTQKADKFAEKFTTKTGKILAFWAAITGLISFGSAFLGVILFMANWFVDLYNLSDNVRKFTNGIEYSYFLDMQEVSGLHEEMETVIMYGVELQKTNNGDLWYFTTVEVNGVERPIIYSANVKRKGKIITLDDGLKAKCHIYIQNMKGEHKWIPDNE